MQLGEYIPLRIFPWDAHVIVHLCPCIVGSVSESTTPKKDIRDSDGTTKRLVDMRAELVSSELDFELLE